MKVRPKEDYTLYTTDIKIFADKVYDAVPATNQPYWKEKGKIFVDKILLERCEYEIVQETSPADMLVSPSPWELKIMPEGDHGIEDARGVTLGLVRKEVDGKLIVLAPATKQMLTDIYDKMNSYSHIHAMRDILYDIEGLLNNGEGITR